MLILKKIMYFKLVDEKALYVTKRNGFQYDLLLSPKGAEAKKLFVLFSGDAIEVKKLTSGVSALDVGLVLPRPCFIYSGSLALS